MSELATFTRISRQQARFRSFLMCNTINKGVGQANLGKTMYTQEKFRKQKVSEILAIVAMALLLIYIADAAVGQGKQGFLPMSAPVRGMIFGGSSIILFFISFGIGIREKSRITTILLIAGGAIIGTSVLGTAAMAKGGVTTIQSSFLVVIVLGYIILGLGVFRGLKKK